MKLFRSLCLVLSTSSRIRPLASPSTEGMPRNRRRLIHAAAAIACICLGAAGARAQTCVVTSTADTNVAGTLRYCLNNLNTGAAATTNVIAFSGSGASGTITLTASLPDIENGITFNGPGANKLAIDGGNLYQVFSIGQSSAPSVIMSGLRITCGKSGAGGGAIDQANGTLDVSNMEFDCNTATTDGGAILADTLTVTNSLFTNNSAEHGGAIGATGALTIANSTFSSNSATTDGGAAFVLATGTLTNNTFYGNSSVNGGAIETLDGPAVLTANNNLFVNNSATNQGGGVAAYPGSTLNLAYNVFYNNSAPGGGADCQGCTSNTNAVDAASNPLTFPLADVGGTTKTFMPQPGSAAICAGSAALASSASLSTDQRGFAMNPAYNPCTSGLVDVGAVQTNYIQVQSSGDSGSGASDCQGVNCTLSDALTLANGNGYGDIDFAPGVTGITLTSGLTLSGTTGINIIGPGANNLTVSGGGGSSNFSVLTVNAAVPAVLYGLTIANGNTSATGGGIINGGTLTVAACAISGNTSGHEGGGIYNSGSLTLVDSTVSGNQGGYTGGGICNTGSATILESTVSGNSSGDSQGGGIASLGALTITNSTIAGNAGNNFLGNGGAGIYIESGTTTLANTIVAGNTDVIGASNIQGAYTDNGGNVVGGSTDATTSLVGGTGAAITLSPLQLNGINAALQTMIPLPGSAAICAGLKSNVSSDFTTDERGYPWQPTGGYCTSAQVDAGAVQTNYISAAWTQQPSNVTVNTPMSPAPTLQILEQNTLLGSNNTDGVNGIPLSLTLTNGNSNLSGGTATTAGSGSNAGTATFPTLEVSQPEMQDQLNLGSVTVGSRTLGPLASVKFNVLGTATQLAVGATSPEIAGTPFSITVTAEDSAGNTITAYTGTVHFTTSDPSASVVLPPNYTFVVGDNGTHTFTGVTLMTAGIQTITATDMVTGTITGTTSVRVDKATPVFSGLIAAPSITYGTATVTLSGTIGQGSFYPPSGDTVSVTIDSSTQPASIGANGAFTVNFPTGSIPASAMPYVVTYSYGGDANFNSLTDNTTTKLTVNKATPTTTVASSSSGTPPTSSVDQSVTFTATVTPPNSADAVTGNVKFADGANTICASAALTWNGGAGNATATCQTSALTAAGSPHSIVATYNGDPNYNTALSSALTQDVSKEATTVTMTAAGAAITVDQSVTLTATVAPSAGSATVPFAGTMSFASQGNTIAGCSAQAVNASTGVATCTTTALLAGSDAITAIYAGDSNYTASPASASTIQVVNKANTTTALSSSSPSNISTTNGSVQFTAVVTAPGNGVSLNGKVVFTDNGTAISACSGATGSAVTWNSTNSTGTATCTTTALIGGTHNIFATYNSSASDTNYNSSLTFLNQTVNPQGTTVTMIPTITPATPTVNQAVTVSATVAPSSGTKTVPFSGTMAFWIGGVAVPGCTAVSASSGMASCTIPSGSAAGELGSAAGYSITAAYNTGDVSYSASAPSTALPVTIAKGTTSAVLTSSQSQSTVNQAVTFTAIVTPTPAGNVALSGTVSFKDSVTGQISNCTAQHLTLVGGVEQATCTTSTLPNGTHTISATYGSDSNFGGSTSNNVTQTVGSATVSAAVAASPSSTSQVNSSVNFVATLTAPSGSTGLTGTVAYFADGAPIAACAAQHVTQGTPSTNWTATCSYSGLQVGSHTISVTYNGDSNFSVSTNSPVTQTVSAGTTSLAFTSPTVMTSTVNQSVAFMVKVTGSPSGSVALSKSATVSFKDSVTGQAIPGCSAQPVTVTGDTATAGCTTAALSVGATAHTITAAYSNDSNFSGTSNMQTQTVGKATTTVNMLTQAASDVNQSVTFTATVTPSPSGSTTPAGTVTFTGSLAGKTSTLCAAIPIALVGGQYQASCSYAFATPGPYSVTAYYAMAPDSSVDPNFSGSSKTVTQTVNQTPLTMTIASSTGGISTVNGPVTFSVSVPVPSGGAGLASTFSFTDSVTGKAIPGCSAIAPSDVAGNWTALCSNYAGLTAGSHSIAVSYGADTNFTIKNNGATISQTVNKVASTIKLSAIAGPAYAFAGNGNSSEYTVKYTATVSPASASVPLSGTVAFSVNGQAITCSSSLAAGVATCTTTTAGFKDGANTIGATYSGDSNYNDSSDSGVQMVEDFSLQVVGMPGGSLGGHVAQGYQASTNPFTPATGIAVSSVSTSYSGTAALTCQAYMDAAYKTPATGAPVCSVNGESLSIASGNGTEPSLTLDFDARSTGNQTPGTYYYQVSATDKATSITRTNTTPIIVTVDEDSSANNGTPIASGSTTNNTGNATFIFSPPVTLSNPKCALIAGTGISKPEDPSKVGVSCIFSQSTFTSSPGTTTVTVLTGGATAALQKPQIGGRHSGMLFAGVLCLPFFGLLGLVRGRKTFATYLVRMIAFLALAIAGLQTMGCGGTFVGTSNAPSTGTTPPGTYQLLIQATGSDGNTYQAVLTVNISL